MDGNRTGGWQRREQQVLCGDGSLCEVDLTAEDGLNGSCSGRATWVAVWMEGGVLGWKVLGWKEKWKVDEE